mgnify:CR=1 FL=1
MIQKENNKNYNMKESWNEPKLEVLSMDETQSGSYGNSTETTQNGVLAGGSVQGGS